MSDIDLEELRLGGIPINCKAADEIERLRTERDDAKCLAAAFVIEIERLRSLLKEAGDALKLCVGSLERGTDATWSHDNALNFLSKIKGET